MVCWWADDASVPDDSLIGSLTRLPFISINWIIWGYAIRIHTISHQSTTRILLLVSTAVMLFLYFITMTELTLLNIYIQKWIFFWVWVGIFVCYIWQTVTLYIYMSNNMSIFSGNTNICRKTIGEGTVQFKSCCGVNSSTTASIYQLPAHFL